MRSKTYLHEGLFVYGLAGVIFNLFRVNVFRRQYRPKFQIILSNMRNFLTKSATTVWFMDYLTGHGSATAQQLVVVSSPRRPGFGSRVVCVGFVEAKLEQDQVPSEFIGFSCQFSFYKCSIFTYYQKLA
jgi:hypothetical protein